MTASSPQPPLPPPPRRRRREPPRRRTALTLDAIVAAALDLLDEEGVSGLSMRRVAARLGTGAASLYAHVAGREELLELVFDELVSRVPLPAPDPARWTEQIHEMLHGLYSELVSHRDAALSGMARIPTTPRTIAAAEVLTATLRAGGITPRVAALGLDQLILYVCAAAFEQSLSEQGMDPAELAAYHAEVHRFFESLPAESFPALAASARDIVENDDQARFRFGISAMLAGYEVLSAREPA